MYIHRGHDGDNYYNYSTSVCVVIGLHVVHSLLTQCSSQSLYLFLCGKPPEVRPSPSCLSVPFSSVREETCFSFLEENCLCVVSLQIRFYVYVGRTCFFEWVTCLFLFEASTHVFSEETATSFSLSYFYPSFRPVSLIGVVSLREIWEETMSASSLFFLFSLPVIGVVFLEVTFAVFYLVMVMSVSS